MHAFVGLVLTTGCFYTAFAQSTNIVEVISEHCDFLILYQPEQTNALSIVLRNEDQGINLRTNEVILVAAESSQITLPAGTPFGNEGEAIWILPQSQDPNLLYLGFSAERIPFGIFARPFNFRLKSVEGPGQFFAWQAAEFGALNVKMNTRDGVGEADKTTPIIGSHEHFNWGFTTSGVYRVTFQVDGQRVGESTNLVSEPATFVFHVLPLPTNAPPTAIELRDPRLLADASFTFHLLGAASQSVVIQATENFAQWVPVTNLLITASPQLITIPADTNQSRRFFRALRP